MNILLVLWLAAPINGQYNWSSPPQYATNSAPPIVINFPTIQTCESGLRELQKKAANFRGLCVNTYAPQGRQ